MFIILKTKIKSSTKYAKSHWAFSESYETFFNRPTSYSANRPKQIIDGMFLIVYELRLCFTENLRTTL
jgi:hypothetical protein